MRLILLGIRTASSPRKHDARKECVVTRADWNLLVLAAAEGNRLTPVQLQKCLFLLGRELPHAVGTDYYDFRPYNYGAFDAAAYFDAERMESQGLTRIVPTPGGWKDFAATPAGLARAAALAQGVPPSVISYLRALVRWARSLSFAQLVRAVYERHPDTKVNSIFRDEQ
jgi:uncharacterized protein